MFAKGYIAINGASLTVSEVNRAEGLVRGLADSRDAPDDGVRDKQVGDAVNIEIERGTQVVVDTVRDGAGKPGQAPAAAGGDPQGKGLSLEDFVTPQQVKLK